MVGINMRRRVVQEEARHVGLSLDSRAVQRLLELVNETGDKSILERVLSAIDQGGAGCRASCNTGNAGALLLPVTQRTYRNRHARGDRLQNTLMLHSCLPGREAS